jgi:peptidoglycan hydrolase CwlO-like protein
MFENFSLEKISLQATKWIGSTASLVTHTCIFILCGIIILAGVPIDRVLLALTTVVSLEAIYLSIFIQMSVNRSEQHLEEIEQDVDEIQKDIDEIQEDVDEIHDEIEEDPDTKHLEHIKKTLANLIKELEATKKPTSRK